jgi:taurine dioxygenase
MYQAFETLSEGMKRLLGPLRAVNASARADRFRAREDQSAHQSSASGVRDYVADHPVVRTHPETGRMALYVNSAHTSHFAGMTEEESAPLLSFLYQHQVRPEFTCRFVWQVGSLAIWDNRCAQHNPVNDYHGFRRVMERITLAGERPV